MRVVAATRNKSHPHGRRPYHLPTCPQVTKRGTVKINWTPYDSPAAARADGRRPCKECSPGG